MPKATSYIYSFTFSLSVIGILFNLFNRNWWFAIWIAIAFLGVWTFYFIGKNDAERHIDIENLNKAVNKIEFTFSDDTTLAINTSKKGSFNGTQTE